MKYEKQLTKVAKDLGLPLDVVREAYFSFWRFLRDKMKEIPLQEDLTEEQFNKYRTSFNVPSLGKFSCSYDRMLNVKKVKLYKRKKDGRF